MVSASIPSSYLCDTWTAVRYVSIVYKSKVFVASKTFEGILCIRPTFGYAYSAAMLTVLCIYSQESSATMYIVRSRSLAEVSFLSVKLSLH